MGPQPWPLRIPPRLLLPRLLMPLPLPLLRLASTLPLLQLPLPLPTLMIPLMLPLPRLLSLLPLTVPRRLPLSQPHTSTTDTMVVTHTPMAPTHMLPMPMVPTHMPPMPMVLTLMEHTHMLVTDMLDTHMFSQLLQQRKSKIPADTEWKYLARGKVIRQQYPGKSCYDSYLFEVRTTVKSKVYSETDTATYHQCSLICKSSLPRNTLRYPMNQKK